MSSSVSKRYEEVVQEINENRSQMQVQYDLLRALTAQKSENESVKKDFDSLEQDATIWKLVGPVMVKQDCEDAKTNVDKRIEFIAADIAKAEVEIKRLEEIFETKRNELLKLQEQEQQPAVLSTNA